MNFKLINVLIIVSMFVAGCDGTTAITVVNEKNKAETGIESISTNNDTTTIEEIYPSSEVPLQDNFEIEKSNTLNDCLNELQNLNKIKGKIERIEVEGCPIY